MAKRRADEINKCFYFTFSKNHQMLEELRREILELVFMLLGQLGKSRRWVRIIILASSSESG
jgi:hypothetical protein